MTRKFLHRIQTTLMLTTLALVSTSASAVFIDFNSLADGTQVTNQFPEASFSSEAGESIFAVGGFICTGSPVNCENDIYIDFTNPVSNLSITAIEPNEFGTVATFFLYSGATLLGTQDLLGLSSTPGQFVGGSIPVSLAGFSGVTRLEIRGPGGNGQIDQTYGGNGIGWDDLSFDVADITSVPEPGPASLMAIAMLALGLSRAQRPRKITNYRVKLTASPAGGGVRLPRRSAALAYGAIHLLSRYHWIDTPTLDPALH